MLWQVMVSCGASGSGVVALKCTSDRHVPLSRAEYLSADCRYFQVYKLFKKHHFKIDLECLLLVVCVYVVD